MLENVRCNVEDHRLFHDGTRVEDITKVDLPKIEHPTTAVKSAGMLMDVDMPNIYHYNSMEIKVSHNNGNGCNLLPVPGPHDIEMRAARQDYSVAKGEIDMELVKVRARVVPKSSEKGSIETDNPYGSTESFSVLRYEEEINGEIWMLIDSTASRLIIAGVDYSDRLSSILD